MSVEGIVPSARPAIAPRHGRARLALTLTLAAAALAGCGSEPPIHLIASETAPDAAHVALVRLVPCDTVWCESLWIGKTPDDASRVSTLPYGAERSDEIAWTRDGKRVAFLVNGYQLRLYDATTHAPAGLMDLVPADAKPTTRIARGVTFSENGAAVTFDDCPRDRSGCKPGLLGIRR